MSTRAQRKAQNLAQQALIKAQAQARGPRPARSSKQDPSAPKPSAPRAKDSDELPGDRVIEAEFVAGAMEREQFPAPAFSEIAFAGRSNVGKSSLMNCLTERRNLVRTSSTPGCTRQVSWFRTTSDDKAVIDLVDLPGYGYAKRSKNERKHWADLIESYLLERATLRGVVLLVDIRRGIEPDDLDLLEMLRSPARVSRFPLQLTLVATKIDKLAVTARTAALQKLTKQAGMPVHGFSAQTGHGRAPLWRRVRGIAGVGVMMSEPAAEVPAAPSESTNDAAALPVAPAL